MSFNKKLAAFAALLSTTNKGKTFAIGEDGSPLVVDSLPAGKIGYFARSTAPNGWLKANGTVVSLEDFPNLIDIYRGDSLNATAIWGYRTTSNSNPGSFRSTTGQFIVLPDLRGEFIRAWDDARGVDVNRAFGDVQMSQNISHSHGVNDPGHRHGSQYDTRTPGEIDSGAAYSEIGGVGTVWSYPTTYSTTGIVIQNNGGNEARPRNISLLACIKY